MTSTVNRYRYYCNTEGLYVYKWDTSPPSTCINNPAHSISLASVSVSDQVTNGLGTGTGMTALSNLTLDQFGILRTITRQTLIEIKSIFGVSQLRDTINTTGTGYVTNTVGNSEYQMGIAGVSDVADFRSAERGKYVVGMSIDIGIGLRIPTAIGTNQRLLWGLYDGTNGLYFKYVGTQLSVNILRNGVETSIPQSAFNVDSLDGNGPSGVVYTPSIGIIHGITFTWYGYGLIDFSIISVSPSNIQTSFSAHRMRILNMTSLTNPNLPLTVRLEGNGNNLSQTVYVAGRQYSIIGEYEPLYRLNSHININFNVPSSTSWIPFMSIRKKLTYIMASALLSSFFAVPTVDMLVEIRRGATLTGANWVTPVDQIATETAVECDTSATGATGGMILYFGYLISGVGAKPTSVLGDDLDIHYILAEQIPITIFVKAVPSNSSVTGVAPTSSLTGILRWKEEF